MFTQPEFKKTYYYIKTNKLIENNLLDVSINNIKKLDNNKGYLLTLYIKDNVFFKNHDKEIINILNSNSKYWFNKDLTEEDINNLYKYTICEQNKTIQILLTDRCIIKFNNKNLLIDDFINMIKENSIIRKSLINININYKGLYVYSKYTLNEWVAKNIYIYTDEDIDTSEINDINESWDNIVQEKNKILDMKIIKIQELKKSINDLYNNIAEEKNIKTWEKKISILKNLFQNIIFQ